MSIIDITIIIIISSSICCLCMCYQCLLVTVRTSLGNWDMVYRRKHYIRRVERNALQISQFRLRAGGLFVGESTRCVFVSYIKNIVMLCFVLERAQNECLD